MLWYGAFLAGCGGERRGGAPPDTLGGKWKLASIEAISADTAPQEVRALGLREARRAVYTGIPDVTVMLYEMTTGPGAFEMVQKWRPRPGAVSFYKDRFFVVCEAAGNNEAELLDFSRLMEASLAE